jgi:hypothetical protein
LPPLIADRKFYRTAIAGRPQTHRDLAVERELERVGDKVEDNLFPHFAVDKDRRGQTGAVDHEAQPGLINCRAKTRCEFGGNDDFGDVAAAESGRVLLADDMLTDIMMPVLDGFGLLRALRNESRGRQNQILDPALGARQPAQRLLDIEIERRNDAQSRP